MTHRKIWVVLCSTTLLGSSAHAGPNPSEVSQFTSILSGDASQVSQWISDQLKYVVPFNSTAGNVIPAQLTFPHFEVGVEGVVSGTQLDTGALQNLNTQLINTSSINTYSRLPFPMVLGHAKIGLPLGFDAGLRFGGIPKTNINSGSTQSSIQNTVVGIDVRHKIIEEGILMPGLTLGLNYTHANGSIDVTSTFNSLTTTINGNPATISNGSAAEHADWTTNSYGIQAILNKKVLIFDPYVGASANYNTGNISNSITATGTANFSDGSQAVTASGSSASSANPVDLRALFGIDLTIFPFVRLNLGGEYAGDKNLAGSFGLHLQF